jgi:hypothetical protein
MLVALVAVLLAIGKGVAGLGPEDRKESLLIIHWVGIAVVAPLGVAGYAIPFVVSETDPERCRRTLATAFALRLSLWVFLLALLGFWVLL